VLHVVVLGTHLLAFMFDAWKGAQVTAEDVRLLDITAGAVVSTWKCPEGRSIAKVASTGSTHLLVATGQGHLYLLESCLSGLTCAASTELNVDIACIDIAHWEEPGEPSATSSLYTATSLRARSLI
jgi:hypothetical protein